MAKARYIGNEFSVAAPPEPGDRPDRRLPGAKSGQRLAALPPVPRKDAAERLQRPVLHRLDGALFSAQGVRDRGSIEPLDEPEYDDLPLNFGEVLQGDLKLSAVKGPLGQSLGCQFNRYWQIQQIHHSGPLPLPVEID